MDQFVAAAFDGSGVLSGNVFTGSTVEHLKDFKNGTVEHAFTSDGKGLVSGGAKGEILLAKGAGALVLGYQWVETWQEMRCKGTGLSLALEVPGPVTRESGHSMHSRLWGTRIVPTPYRMFIFPDCMLLHFR